MFNCCRGRRASATSLPRYSGTTTSVQTGASIYNGDLERIQIDAHGTVGTAGECHIIVG